jgi:hypothetical protein
MAKIPSSHASAQVEDISSARLKKEWKRNGQGMSLKEYARTRGEHGEAWLAKKAA